MESGDSETRYDDRRADSACSACHRRKLKCDRSLDGCSNCQKSNIPCIYDAHSRQMANQSNVRDSRRKPRGPYKKGKTPREKELEHVVEMLQEKLSSLDTHNQSQSSPSDPARTSTSYSSPSNIAGDASFIQFNLQNPATSFLSSSISKVVHPSPCQILELWMIYSSTLNKLTKIVHHPTVTEMLLISKDRANNLEPSTEALMLGIYLAALDTLDAEQVFSQFGTRKDSLIRMYQSALNELLQSAESLGSESLEMLQAAVIYLACLRRQPGPGATIPSVFAWAVKLADHLGLQDLNTYASVTPFEAEMRRRAWWMLCRHESAYAEEVNSRKTSIFRDTNIPLPMNYNDDDLDPLITTLPMQRVGLTEMSFALMTLENVRSVGRLAQNMFEKSEILGPSEMRRSQSLRDQSKDLWIQTRNRIEQEILQFCDPSRSFDLLILIAGKIIMTKSEILILDPPAETDVAACNAFHDVKVSLSLDTIECHELLLNEGRLHKYRSQYQHIHQWFAIIYVLEQVAKRPNAAFASRVWHVIDAVLIRPDLLNKHGMQVQHRSKLLELHGQALEARESLLRDRSMAVPEQYIESVNTLGDPVTIDPESMLASEPSSMRVDPWQFNQSLFDVQDAQLNFDALFWPPSAKASSSMSMQDYRFDESNVPAS